jgi:hypothetical protein
LKKGPTNTLTSLRSRDITIFQDKVIQLATDFGRFAGEGSRLQSAAARIQTLSEELSAKNGPITAMSSMVTASQTHPAISALNLQMICDTSEWIDRNKTLGKSTGKRTRISAQKIRMENPREF